MLIVLVRTATVYHLGKKLISRITPNQFQFIPLPGCEIISSDFSNQLS